MLHTLAPLAYAGDVAAVAYLTRRYVMARGLPYSPEEDAIIVATSVTADALARLQAAGYPERTPNAVKQRRGELRKNGKLGMRYRSTGPASPMVAAATDLEVAKSDVARLREQLAQAEATVQSARKRLATELAREK